MKTVLLSMLKDESIKNTILEVSVMRQAIIYLALAKKLSNSLVFGLKIFMN
jgi:hypothetical protein